MFRNGIGVRLRLSLLSLAAILPLSVLLVGGLATDRHLAIRAARIHATDLAKLIAERQADSLQQATELLRALRRVPNIQDDDENCHATLEAVAADNPQFNTIGIVGSNGLITCHSIITVPQKFVDQGFLRDVINSDPTAVHLSEFRVGQITGKPTVFVAIPLAPRNGIAAGPGMIFVALNLDRFAKVARQFVGSENWNITLIDARSKTVLAEFPENRSLIGKSFPDHPLTKAMAERPNGGSVETDDFDGKKRIYGFAPLPSAGGSLIMGVGLERSLVLADANHRVIIGLSLALMAAICAACGAWFLGDLWQLRPINALVTAARRLGNGDFTARVEIASWHAPEFRALGRTLNEMAIDIATFQKLLVESKAQLALLAENATDLVFQLDLDFARRYISPACQEILGYSPEELLGTVPFDMIHPDDVDRVRTVFQSVIRGEVERTSLIYRMRHRKDYWVWVHSGLRALRDPQTLRPTGLLGALRDISVLKAAEDAVRESEARYRLLADNVADLIISLNLDLKPTYVSPASRQLIGCDPDELAALSLEDFVWPEDRACLQVALSFLQENGQLDDFRFRVQHRNGTLRWLEMSGRKPVGSDSIVLVLRDITMRQQAEDQLAQANSQLTEIAARDFLTGIANRRAFEDLLEKEFRRAMRNASSLALIMIDVDKFKVYNDLYGHPAGDDCLRKIAQAVKGVLQRPSDLAARYGGEEIVVLLPNTDEAGAFVVAQRIRATISNLKIEHRGNAGHIATISAGVAAIVPSEKAKSCAELVDAADQALYAAKEAGRDAVVAASSQELVIARPLRRGWRSRVGPG